MMPAITDPIELADAIDDAASLILRWGHGQMRQLPASEIEIILAALRAVAKPEAARTEALSTPEDVQEWVWHMDLHLTEHDERHAGLALRAAWPHVRAYLDRLLTASADAQKLMYETAGYCRLSVMNVHDNRMEEQAVKLDKAARQLGAIQSPQGSTS